MSDFYRSLASLIVERCGNLSRGIPEDARSAWVEPSGETQSTVKSFQMMESYQGLSSEVH